MQQPQGDEAHPRLVRVEHAEGMNKDPDPGGEAEGGHSPERDELEEGPPGFRGAILRRGCRGVRKRGPRPCGEQVQPVARLTAGRLSMENVQGSIRRPGSVLSLRISKEVLPSVAA